MNDTEPVKLIILGEYGVGKTSLLSCFINEKHDSFPQFYKFYRKYYQLMS